MRTFEETWNEWGFHALIAGILICITVIGGIICYSRANPRPYAIACDEVVEQAEYRDSRVIIMKRPMVATDVPRTIIVRYNSWWEVRFPLQITERHCP